MPVAVEGFKGRLLDADSHIELPPPMWDEAIGPVFAGMMRARLQRAMAHSPAVADRFRMAMAASPAEPDESTIWERKMWAAPGAHDPEKRLRAVDLLGVERQLLFPMAVPAAMMLANHELSAQVAETHNTFVLSWAGGAGGRLRPVAVINMEELDRALAEARRVADLGAYAFNVGCGRPPAGLSPADPAWEPLWDLAEQAGIPVLLHIGGEFGLVPNAWGDAELLRAGHSTPLDGEGTGPFNLSVTPFGPQAFLTALILGGVLERHPDLHLGVIEMTAQWVGPFAEMLDQRFDLFTRLGKVLSMRPSEYIARQVRVTPFWWEPVGKYIERYGLEDVYVFSTDFPHVEGGTEPLQRFHASLAGHPDEVYEKFFVTNARLIV
ncbi:MAG TPA: amidohydrolase family protein [Acidimicrobiales bacterium]|nr:amidohydrolase family protein [Acidimicrobiales bacterium]